MYFLMTPILYRHVGHKLIQKEQIPSFFLLTVTYTMEFLEVLHKHTPDKLVVLCVDRQSMMVQLQAMCVLDMCKIPDTISWGSGSLTVHTLIYVHKAWHTVHAWFSDMQSCHGHQTCWHRARNCPKHSNHLASSLFECVTWGRRTGCI